MKKAIKNGLKRLHRPPSALNFAFIRENLQGDKIYIADVGAYGGLEERWDPFIPLSHFYAFDPEPRAAASAQGSLFQIGLWSTRETKKLNLSKSPTASSLYAIDKQLASFLNWPCHEVIQETFITVDTMESVLKGHPTPDFIKVDAEGADLEILKGGQSFLSQSCFGVQIEVSLNLRHENAPLFSEVDAFLRKYGFQLFDLHTERWIRKNHTFGLQSRPQLMWGDAVYFLSKEKAMQQLRSLSPPEKKKRLMKWMILLIAYQLHDFAVEIFEESIRDKMIDSFFCSTCIAQIRTSATGSFTYFLRLLLAMSIGAYACAILYPFPSLRPKAVSFFKGRVNQLLGLCLKFTSEGEHGTVHL